MDGWRCFYWWQHLSEQKKSFMILPCRHPYILMAKCRLSKISKSLPNITRLITESIVISRLNIKIGSAIAFWCRSRLPAPCATGKKKITIQPAGQTVCGFIWAIKIVWFQQVFILIVSAMTLIVQWADLRTWMNFTGM